MAGDGNNGNYKNNTTSMKATKVTTVITTTMVRKLSYFVFHQYYT